MHLASLSFATVVVSVAVGSVIVGIIAASIAICILEAVDAIRHARSRKDAHKNQPARP